jgi:hypothetical protein
MSFAFFSFRRALAPHFCIRFTNLPLAVFLVSAVGGRAQTLTTSDLTALQNGTSIPSTHLVRALGAEAQKSLGTQYSTLLGTPDAQQSDVAFKQLVQNYKTAKQQTDIGSSVLKTTDYLVKTAVVGGLEYSGVGTIAAPIAGVVSDLALGEVESAFTTAATNDLQRLLKTGLLQVQTSNQTEYARLLTLTNPPQFISALDHDVNGLFGNALNNIPSDDQLIVNDFRLQETTEIMKNGFGWVSTTTGLQQTEIDTSRQ